uniref:Thrombospondin-like N-terminal domain-containing protein n=1 Tax=Pseudonaja textilis TaxID=8673 RepID=A0A670YJR3_PSETE
MSEFKQASFFLPPFLSFPGIDVLRHLGLSGQTMHHPTTGPLIRLSHASSPQGIHLTAFGVLLSIQTAIEVPISQVGASALGSNFAILISLRSYKVNNAFLFSIRNKNRLQFGIQLLPRKIIVHTGGKHSVYFDYRVHDEQWHTFAIDVTEKSVSLYTQCGRKHFSKEILSKVQFDSHSLFTLGRMNFQSVNFEGVLCQLDIIPSAQTLTNYCKYVKLQCRQADTYWFHTISPSEENSSKLLDEVTQPLSKRKGTLNLHVSKSALVKDPQELMQTTSSLTPLYLGNITALSEPNDQQIVNVSKKHQHYVSKRKGDSLPLTKLTLNYTDSMTENMKRKMNSSLLFSIKQPNAKHMMKNTSKPYLYELMDMHPFLNTTLHEDFHSEPLINQFSSWDEHTVQTDEIYNAEGNYEFDADYYDYDYEEWERLLDMENLKGPKGDPGQVVSGFHLWYLIKYTNSQATLQGFTKVIIMQEFPVISVFYANGGNMRNNLGFWSFITMNILLFLVIQAMVVIQEAEEMKFKSKLEECSPLVTSDYWIPGELMLTN